MAFRTGGIETKAGKNASFYGNMAILTLVADYIDVYF